MEQNFVTSFYEISTSKYRVLDDFDGGVSFVYILSSVIKKNVNVLLENIFLKN